MPTFTTRRIVAHGPAAMFDLVADIERYPEFLPLCEALEVRTRHKEADGTELITARMTVGYGPIRESFLSRVRLDRANQVILVDYLDGPFRSLENRWTFRDHAKGAEVEFFIAYEFKSLALQLLMGAMFDTAFRRFQTAFEERANRVYGRAGPSAEPLPGRT